MKGPLGDEEQFGAKHRQPSLPQLRAFRTAKGQTFARQGVQAGERFPSRRGGAEAEKPHQSCQQEKCVDDELPKKQAQKGRREQIDDAARAGKAVEHCAAEIGGEDESARDQTRVQVGRRRRQTPPCGKKFCARHEQLRRIRVVAGEQTGVAR